MDSPSVVRRRQEMAAFAAAQAQGQEQAPPESACLYCRGGGCPYCRVPESEAAPEPVAERPSLLARLTSWWAPQEPEGPDAQSEADASAAGEDVASTPETEVEVSRLNVTPDRADGSGSESGFTEAMNRAPPAPSPSPRGPPAPPTPPPPVHRTPGSPATPHVDLE